MPCALEIIDTRFQSTSHIRCNRSFDRNICSHFSKDHPIQKLVSDRPENRDIALTLLPLGHDSPAPFLSGIQEVNMVIPLTSGRPGIEGQTAQPRILCCLGQPNEGNMHDQADYSEPVSNGTPHGGSTLRQSRHRKNVCNSLTACPPCHVVAKKLSRSVNATLRPDSDILHDDDKPPKRNPRKKGTKKGKQYKQTVHKKLNLASEITFEDNTYGVSPVEVLPINLPVDKLSEATSSASSLVKEAHMGKSDGGNNNAYVECVTMMNLSTLGTDGMDGSDCTGSSSNAAAGRLSCSYVPYLNDESNTTDYLEIDGSTFTEHGLGDESNSYQKLRCACVCKPDCATTDYFFTGWNNENSGSYNANVEARLTIKDENRHGHLQLGPSIGLSNVITECQLLGSHLSATHAEDTNDPIGNKPCSSKYVRDSCTHTERVQCSSEACSSKPSLQFSSGRRTGKSKRTPSYSDLTVSRRVISANRHKNNGRDVSAVWQKVERNCKIISKGHSGNSPVEDKGAHEYNNKGVQEDPIKLRVKQNQNRKACKQESPNETVELECTKEEGWCVKLTENSSQESCKWYSAAGHLSQKWVPVGKKETSNAVHLDVSEALLVEDSIPANDISNSVGPASTNGEDSKLASEITFKLNSPGHVGLECRAHNGTETDYSMIKEAISYVHTAQQRVEDIHLHIGRPIADFEQFVYSASPVMHCNPCFAGGKSYMQECMKDGLCLDQAPEITLNSVWQWYEEPSCYGLVVKAQDLHRSRDLSSSHCQFTTYFVPYLSAVQVFAPPKRTNGGSTDNEGMSPHVNPPPIFAKLLPQQCNSRNRSSTLCTDYNKQQENGEVIFEFFESEQPYWRRQLFEKVNELIAGVKPTNCQISGDPKSLELSLHDLHPASWYCVAWYPIYRIPDGKFQAAFLTYHSLGHWTCRSSGEDPGFVLPVIGLQSYNDKAERWFEMSKPSSSEDCETTQLRCSEASQALKQRLCTLNNAAAAMSRASVLKKEQTSRNRHLDYEFFLSRR